MSRKLLLWCGVASSIVYLAMDILGSLRWQGYSYADQTISELAALDAPSRSIALPLGLLYNLLLLPFAAGVAAGHSRAMRGAGACIAGIAMAGLIATLFPIQMRGVGTWTINETMHVSLTAVTVFLIVAAMSSGAAAAGRGFFIYSLVSVTVMLIFGGLTAANGAALAANLPTPWMGVTERICIFSYLVWIAALAIVLIRISDSRPVVELRGHYASRQYVDR